MRAIIRCTVAVLAVLWGAETVYARGFGGSHPSGTSHGGSHPSGTSPGGSAAGRESASGARGSEAARGGASSHSYQGAHGGSGGHGTAAAQGAATGPRGAAAGEKAVSATKVKGPDGNTYAHESSAGRGVAAGPGGVTAGRYAATGSSAHAPLPTDAGHGTSVARTAAVSPGYHQTAAIDGNVTAARGAAVRNSYSAANMYGADWHAARPGAWAAPGWEAGRAWTPATWNGTAASLGWGAAVQPLTFNYGTDITYQGNQVYYGSQPVATADEYYQQASSLAQTAPAADPQAGEWMPLGVFAMVHSEQSDPQFVLQMAINKSGAVAGNYTDRISEATVPIQGAVDKKTQRVAWTVGKNKSTVAETGLYNLTQDEAPLLIHMGKDRTQQWLLVRLKQPQQ